MCSSRRRSAKSMLRRPWFSHWKCRGDVPDGVAVIDLVERRIHGSGGVVLDSVREFCRKRGIKLDPGPWKYSSGLV